MQVFQATVGDRVQVSEDGAVGTYEIRKGPAGFIWFVAVGGTVVAKAAAAPDMELAIEQAFEGEINRLFARLCSDLQGNVQSPTVAYADGVKNALYARDLALSLKCGIPEGVP